jgi:hypothetical protein
VTVSQPGVDEFLTDLVDSWLVSGDAGRRVERGDQLPVAVVQRRVCIGDGGHLRPTLVADGGDAFHHLGWRGLGRLTEAAGERGRVAHDLNNQVAAGHEVEVGSIQVEHGLGRPHGGVGRERALGEGGVERVERLEGLWSVGRLPGIGARRGGVGHV